MVKIIGYVLQLLGYEDFKYISFAITDCLKVSLESFTNWWFSDQSGQYLPVSQDFSGQDFPYVLTLLIQDEDST